jgi:hypothetical protein
MTAKTIVAKPVAVLAIAGGTNVFPPNFANPEAFPPNLPEMGTKTKPALV